MDEKTVAKVRKLLATAVIACVSGGIATSTSTAAYASSQPPAGVPGNYLGAERVDLNGAQLYQHPWWWLHDPGRGGQCYANSGQLSVTKQDWVRLSTNGEYGNCAELWSSQAYTAGVFEMKIWFPGNSGGIVDFPSYWMSGSPWPYMGEIDAAEAYARQCLSFTYHWNRYGLYGPYSPVETHDGIPNGGCLSRQARTWLTIDIVRTSSGIVEVWFNGHKKLRMYTHMAPQPEHMILDITNDGPGVPANMYLSFVRVWNFR